MEESIYFFLEITYQVLLFFSVSISLVVVLVFLATSYVCMLLDEDTENATRFVYIIM